MDKNEAFKTLSEAADQIEQAISNMEKLSQQTFGDSIDSLNFSQALYQLKSGLKRLKRAMNAGR
jgi:hypothetical protein